MKHKIMAQLYYRHGTMASGKSVEIFKIAHNYEDQGKKVHIFSPALDTRSGLGRISSRMGLTRPATAVDINTDIFKIVQANPVDCVLVDEAQFLLYPHVIMLKDIVDKLNIPVICYGLKNDFRNKLFTGSEALLILADKIEEIKAVCKFCNKKALMHLRIQNNKYVREGEQITIGDKDVFISVCRNHWFNPPPLKN